MFGVFCFPDFVLGTHPSCSQGIRSSSEKLSDIVGALYKDAYADDDEAAYAAAE